MLKKLIKELVKDAEKSIRKSLKEGKEMIDLTTDLTIVCGGGVPLESSLSGTCLEKGQSLKSIIDFLYQTAMSTRLTNLLAPQVEDILQKNGCTVYVDMMIALAVRLTQAGYPKGTVEMCILNGIPDILGEELDEYEHVTLFLQAVHIHNAPLPKVKYNFDIPSRDNMDNSEWWIE